nr:hypothetical protein FAC6B23_19 [Penicillium fuscum]UXX61842.1 hypothetical protein FAC4N16_15 [Penicillium fuscum]
MTFVEGTLLSNRLRSPSSLDIEHAFRGMAQVMLELSKPVFPRIGVLAQKSGAWEVVKRPLTLNMNELVRVGNLPPGEFAEGSFRTAGEYFQELAAQQLLHLQFQRNDAVDDELDCRKKYIARCLFRKIARKIPAEHFGPFHLYCDDLRPSNVLVSGPNFAVTGVIDWEYTYVAPVEFTYTAPWWLLFESPEAWEADLNLFLCRVLRWCEDEQIKKQAMEESQRLSIRMAQSMENGLFWFCLAAKKSFMFDEIYWTFLDQKHFGNGSLEDRLSLLSKEELDGLERLVPVKTQQARESRLEEHLSYDDFVDY